MLDRKRVLVSLLSPPMGHIRLNSLKRGETRRFLEQAALCDGTLCLPETGLQKCTFALV